MATRRWEDVRAELIAAQSAETGKPAAAIEAEIALATAFQRGRVTGYEERLLEELDPDCGGD